MKVFAPFAAALLFAASTVAVEPLEVNTPLNATVCEPLLFSWSGGTPPYTLTLIELLLSTLGVGIAEFNASTDTSLTWVVNIVPIPASQGGPDSLVLRVVDGTGNFSDSATFPIQDSDNHACLPASTGSSSSHSTSTATTPTSSSIIAGMAPSSGSGQVTSKSSILSEGKIWGIGLGVLAAVLLVGLWRLYVLRTRRKSSGNYGDRENLGIDQKFPLSPIQKHPFKTLG